MEQLQTKSNVTDLGGRIEESIRAGVYRIFNFERVGTSSLTFDDYDPDQDILDYWGESQGLKIRHTRHSREYSKAAEQDGSPGPKTPQ